MQMLSASIFKERMLPLLERELPDVARELFGTAKLRGMHCAWSSGEPAVNRYEEGGGVSAARGTHALALSSCLDQV